MDVDLGAGGVDCNIKGVLFIRLIVEGLVEELGCCLLDPVLLLLWLFLLGLLHVLLVALPGVVAGEDGLVLLVHLIIETINDEEHFVFALAAAQHQHHEPEGEEGQLAGGAELAAAADGHQRGHPGAEAAEGDPGEELSDQDAEVRLPPEVAALPAEGLHVRAWQRGTRSPLHLARN